MCDTGNGVIFTDAHTHLLHNRAPRARVYNVFAQDLACVRPPGYYSSGVHPWHCEDVDNIDELFDQLRLVAGSDPCMVAIGEIGLDRKRKVDWMLQVRVFETQIQLARDCHKPIIIHSVGTHDDVLRILHSNRVTCPVIFHGFCSSARVASKIIDRGHYLSLGLRSLQMTNEVFEHVKPDTILVESDESNDLRFIYESLSQRFGIDCNDFSRKVSDTFCNVYGIEHSMIAQSLR